MMKDNVYSDMINHHRENVKKAWELMAPELSALDDYTKDKITKLIKVHDMSKYTDEEYYTFIEVRLSANTDLEVANEKMHEAKIIHLNKNPYHWQYYNMLDENGHEGLRDMPENYIVEMACDYVASMYEEGLKSINDKWRASITRAGMTLKSKKYLMSLLPAMEVALGKFC